MQTISKALAAKKQKLSSLFKSAWQFVKLEKLTLSQALRKAWLLVTKLADKLRFTVNLLDPRTIQIVDKSTFIGEVKILDGGFIQGRNRTNSSKVFKCRHDAINFALSTQKVKITNQLPLL